MTDFYMKYDECLWQYKKKATISGSAVGVHGFVVYSQFMQRCHHMDSNGLKYWLAGPVCLP